VKSQSKYAKYTGELQVDLHVLKGVSGYALPGQTLFIMGASGAGKTSLLNIICDRINTNNSKVKLTGKVLINN
jgi:ABC-type multidrug transport system ATPase subunit